MLKQPPRVGFFTLVLLGTSVGALSLAAYFYHLLGEQKKENAALVAQLKPAGKTPPSLTEGSDAAAKNRPTGGASDSASTDGVGDGTAGDTASGGRSENGRSRDGNARLTAFRELMNSPDVIKLMTLQQKGELDGRYADLFKKLKLPPAALEQLKGLLVERQNISRDVFSAARQEGMGRENRDEIEALIKVSRDENAALIRGLLGEEAYKEYEAYNQNSAERRLVDQIGYRVSYSAAPLSDQQNDQLVKLLAAASAQPAAAQNSGSARTSGALAGAFREIGRFGLSDSTGTPAITDQVINQAATFLNQQQLDALRQIQAEQQAQAKLRETFSEAAVKASNAAKPKDTARKP